MTIESSRDYRMRRARFELDLADRAEGWAALQAHLKLSALHMALRRETVTVGCVRGAAC